MIQLKDVNLKLPGFSLENINIDIGKGDFFALIGPTGSGKSLLLEGMMGLVRFTSGQLKINGKEMNGLPVEQRELAIVYQDYSLFPHLDVTQNIRYGIRYHSISKKDEESRFDSLVSTLGLERILARRPHNLSGGEKQRVALARALILNPGVLLLDEPLSALDPIFHDGAKKLLKKIHRETGITMVMVSHNFQDVIFLADKGAVIHQGRILQQGNILTIFDKPSSRFTADFVGMKNIRPIRIWDNRMQVEDDGLQIEPGALPDVSHKHMGIRPEDIVFDFSGSGDWENQFQGIVQSISNHGAFLDVRLKVGKNEFDAVWPRSYLKEHGLVPGKKVSFGFNSESVHTF